MITMKIKYLNLIKAVLLGSIERLGVIKRFTSGESWNKNN